MFNPIKLISTFIKKTLIRRLGKANFLFVVFSSLFTTSSILIRQVGIFPVIRLLYHLSGAIRRGIPLDIFRDTYLNRTNPGWEKEFVINSNIKPEDINFFINSPLESGDINSWLIERLSDYLILQFVILYLLIMITLILTSKFLLERDIQFETISKYKLGKYVSKFFITYINIWKVSGNFWLIFINFFVLFFNLVSIYSLTQIIDYLKNIF